MMETGGSQSDYEHHDYENDEDLPCTPDGNDPTIASNNGIVVDKVKGTSGRCKGRACVRKTIAFVETDHETQEADKRAFIKEARILNRARHGHVVELFMTYFYNNRFAIIMDRAQGNLLDYLRGRKPPGQISQISKWFGCLIGVVVYIHGIGIRHRDIKPENILVKDKKVLLADFGISKMGLGKTMPTTVPEWARARTQKYCAPEVEEGSTRGRSADIFSLGAVFLEMLIAHSYPSERAGLMSVLASDNGQSYAKNIGKVREWMADMKGRLQPVVWHSTVLSLCVDMLHEDRDERPLAEELDSCWSNLASSDGSLACCKCAGVPMTESNKLVEACKRGSLDEVESLLNKHADPSTMGAIHQASARGFGDVVRSLLDKGANVDLQDYSGQTPLHCAAGYGHDEIVQMLLEKHANIAVKDDEGKTALHCAAGHESKSVVEKLLKNGAEIRAEDGEGQTALHFAARRGHNEVIRLLLKQGADVRAMDKRGRAALHFAAGHGSKDVVQLLLKKGANVNIPDRLGRTELHFAISGEHAGGQHKDVVEMLLEKGADAKLKDREGQTVLHFAARRGHKEIAEKFLKSGANVTERDSKGRMAHWYAENSGFNEVAQLLREAQTVGSIAGSHGRV